LLPDRLSFATSTPPHIAFARAPPYVRSRDRGTDGGTDRSRDRPSDSPHCNRSEVLPLS